jgi:hypothetical protein
MPVAAVPVPECAPARPASNLDNIPGINHTVYGLNALHGESAGAGAATALCLILHHFIPEC